jgi:hypothetical protein
LGVGGVWGVWGVGVWGFGGWGEEFGELGRGHIWGDGTAGRRRGPCGAALAAARPAGRAPRGPRVRARPAAPLLPAARLPSHFPPSPRPSLADGLYEGGRQARRQEVWRRYDVEQLGGREWCWTPGGGAGRGSGERGGWVRGTKGAPTHACVHALALWSWGSRPGKSEGRRGPRLGGKRVRVRASPGGAPTLSRLKAAARRSNGAVSSSAQRWRRRAGWARAVGQGASARRRRPRRSPTAAAHMCHGPPHTQSSPPSLRPRPAPARWTAAALRGGSEPPP